MSPATITAKGKEFLSDIPPLVRQDHTIQAIQDSLAREIDKLDAAKALLLADIWPQTADALLAYDELFLKLAVDPETLTLQERRDIVLAYLRKALGAGSGLRWEEAMSQFFGGDWTYKEFIPSAQRRRNELRNPSYEADTQDTAAISGSGTVSRVTSDALQGTASAEWVGTASVTYSLRVGRLAAPVAAATPGELFLFRTAIKLVSNTGTVIGVGLRSEFGNAVGASLGMSPLSPPTRVPATGAWVEYEGLAFAPANADRVMLRNEIIMQASANATTRHDKSFIMRDPIKYGAIGYERKLNFRLDELSDFGGGTLVGDWTVSSGKLLRLTDTAGQAGPSGQVAVSNGKWQLRFKTGASVAAHRIGFVLRKIDSNNYIRVSEESSTLKITKVDGGVPTDLSTVAQALSASTEYTLEVVAHGDCFAAILWTGDPGTGTVVNTLSCTVMDADKTKFGSGVSGSWYIDFDPPASFADWEIQEVRRWDPITTALQSYFDGSAPFSTDFVWDGTADLSASSEITTAGPFIIEVFIPYEPGSIQANVGDELVKEITPANLAINVNVADGFILGVSSLGDVL